jgi:hypothetical protein
VWNQGQIWQSSGGPRSFLASLRRSSEVVVVRNNNLFVHDMRQMALKVSMYQKSDSSGAPTGRSFSTCSHDSQKFRGTLYVVWGRQQYSDCAIPLSSSIIPVRNFVVTFLFRSSSSNPLSYTSLSDVLPLFSDHLLEVLPILHCMAWPTVELHWPYGRPVCCSNLYAL